ncbi:type I glyceraldehyde-3-phosphate dehydrogenase [candidate division WWE3 bacterium RIFCSPLOWO2_01_FULL_42_11]|uniref:Type I glyceraldehyde-3-phosphate dehydrogenase n=1 Tax=candidate division WWE3 bacterium RIFCSPLOWO2_01_FULL_42_11 TaxID=1802627 RepID=A0A1F4VR67_UNCKA|nr:MAG: type I glyceraldehyde-3-phosphate dehydrogenase [candidate division WWE3 bacterium RIFCSPLOWO2_01_FULL_42_11]
MVTAAINGFGRIGRIAFRIALESHSKEVDIVAINTSGSMDALGWAHLLRYDSVYGKFSNEVLVEGPGEDPEIGVLVIEGKRYPILAQREPSKIPWKRYGAEVVIESTGVFISEEGARQHITAGAKKVVITSPDKGGNVGTYLIGVNEYKGAHDVVSNGSCTTNCVAPVAAVIQGEIGIKKAMLSTLHAVTAEQNTVDGSPPGGHLNDLRRARAAFSNIIPTSTGAAQTVTRAIPELSGLFDGMAIRVPILCGSIVDFTFVTKRATSVEEVNGIFKKAAENPRWKGILAVTDEPLVSSDIVGRTESAIVDLSLTKVEDGDLVKVLAWYDNEWGFSHRLIEQVIAVGSHQNA